LACVATIPWCAVVLKGAGLKDVIERPTIGRAFGVYDIAQHLGGLELISVVKITMEIVGILILFDSYLLHWSLERRCCRSTCYSTPSRVEYLNLLGSTFVLSQLSTRYTFDPIVMDELIHYLCLPYVIT
jgi:hypothetical protein